MSKDKKVYKDFPSIETLDYRNKIFLLVYSVVPFLFLGIADALITFTPLGGSPERMGFLLPESFLFGFFAFQALIFLFIFIVRSVVYMQGFDVPDKAEIDKRYNEKDIGNVDPDLMVRDNNYQIAAMFAVVLIIVFFLLFLIQWGLGALWHWNPLAIGLPVLVVSPFVGAYFIRRHNRKRKIEQEIIMKELEGKH